MTAPYTVPSLFLFLFKLNLKITAVVYILCTTAINCRKHVVAGSTAHFPGFSEHSPEFISLRPCSDVLFQRESFRCIHMERRNHQTQIVRFGSFLQQSLDWFREQLYSSEREPRKNLRHRDLHSLRQQKRLVSVHLRYFWQPLCLRVPFSKQTALLYTMQKHCNKMFCEQPNVFVFTFITEGLIFDKSTRSLRQTDKTLFARFNPFCRVHIWKNLVQKTDNYWKMAHSVPTITFNNGIKVPMIGLGTSQARSFVLFWLYSYPTDFAFCFTFSLHSTKVKTRRLYVCDLCVAWGDNISLQNPRNLLQPNVEGTQKAVEDAIDVGYRHIDTALWYRNEKEIGLAIQNKIADGTVTRDKLFITTKVTNPNPDHHFSPQKISHSNNHFYPPNLICWALVLM